MKKLLLFIGTILLISCSNDETNQASNPTDTQAPNTIILKSFLVEENGPVNVTDASGVVTQQYYYMFQADFKSTYSVDKKGSVKIYFTENGIAKTKLVEDYFYFQFYIGSNLVTGRPLKANSITNFRNNNWYLSRQTITVQNIEFIEN
jgi:hypothetical protein